MGYANYERQLAANTAWRVANPEKWKASKRRSQLKALYGITEADYDQMLAAQGGHCALCSRTPEQESTGKLHVDHCHETGAVRGLLCRSHNVALGALGDNVAGLEAALQYLLGGCDAGN
jgi:hypothetical protein